MDTTGLGLASPPSPFDKLEYSNKLLRIRALVVVSVLALLLLHVLGSLRRASSHKYLHTVLLGVYTLSYTLVSYTLGLMQASQHYFVEFPVWAVCLLMLLGSTDELMVCNLNDVKEWKSFHMKHLLQGGMVIYIVVFYGQAVPEYQMPLWGILFVNVLRSCVRIKSMKMASKSNLLAKNVKPIIDYMKGEENQRLASHGTMIGCRYIVAGEHRLRNNGKQIMDMSRDKEVDNMKITTVEKIWQCEESLLPSDLKNKERYW